MIQPTTITLMLLTKDFHFKNGKKDFILKEGIPYVFNNTLNKEIKFNSLHFQGGAKNLIRSVYDRC